VSRANSWTGDDAPKDDCGVFAVYAPGEAVARLTYFGLYALQHRGQESAGIAVSQHGRLRVYKDMGLVSQVFNAPALTPLTGDLAIGHVRYSTTGASTWENAQPTFGATPSGDVALAHNGNLTNTAALAGWLAELTPDAGHRPGVATSDTTLLTALLAAQPGSTDQALDAILPRLEGAFSLVILAAEAIWAVRDRHGLRPLCLGQLDQGWVLASESAALDIVGASFVRELAPGEVVRIDAQGVASRRFADPRPQVCLFEYVYLSRPDSLLGGRTVHNIRVKIGKLLAEQCPAEADLVMPVPDSGTPAAIGYAAGSGIAYGQGFVKNAYVGRTFIQPTQQLRQLGIRLKLNPLRQVVAGKRLVVVDDSIVRGNTQRQVIAMLRAAGAAEVHVRIASPPVMWPCYFGIDLADQGDLIAAQLDVAAIASSLGADSLGYVSLDALIAATHQPADELCTACFSGRYVACVPPAAAAGLGLGPNCRGQATQPPALRAALADCGAAGCDKEGA